ncbi:succinylglutamate desuccinylase/aspartoacylase family protein [Pleurocapsales cyanobacterium LEGE 06147]|nr:succinylglutamate desuccinylase/aspartoacylase family protein [Pleurocapsales cyanobacterium LEGE 06147]
MKPLISTIDLLKLSSGDLLYLQVYKFIGKQPGKKVYIQANLHGAEIVGNEVIYQLIDFLITLDESQIEGEIWLVPVCNPLGTNQRSHFFSTGRFNSYDGKNWNRIFWDYEKEFNELEIFAGNQVEYEVEEISKNYLAKIKIAWQQELNKIKQPSSVPWDEQYRYHLQSLCLDANYVIDIHSSSNQAIDYLYCFQERQESAKYFLLEQGILIDEYDGNSFDEAFLKPWLALEKKLAQLGKKVTFDLESWTLELGSGMQINPDSVIRGVSGIKNYLTYQGILKLTENHSLQKVEINLVKKSQIQDYYAPTGGMIRARIPLGSKIKRGDKLYQILSFNKQTKLPTVIEVCAETDGLVFDVATNQAVNQGEYVLGMMNANT